VSDLVEMAKELAIAIRLEDRSAVQHIGSELIAEVRRTASEAPEALSSELDRLAGCFDDALGCFDIPLMLSSSGAMARVAARIDIHNHDFLGAGWETGLARISQSFRRR
jgi:hypothetical protein